MMRDRVIGESVDIHDHFRKHEIREAEFQQQADADSRVLRVTGKVPYGPNRSLPAITARERM